MALKNCCINVTSKPAISLKLFLFIASCTSFIVLNVIYNKSTSSYFDSVVAAVVDNEQTPDFQLSNMAGNGCHEPYEFLSKGSVNYSVLLSFVKAEEYYEYKESVTYVTHASYGLLNNVEEISLRWDGPISVAVYAPYSDFYVALNVIARLRQCSSPLVKKLVTFHVYYETIYEPIDIPCNFSSFLDEIIVDCDVEFMVPPESDAFKASNNLTYPVNVGRNIARIQAETKYVLVVDIELFPSANMVPWFIEMIRKSSSPDKTVYVLPVFEVDATQVVPSNKSTLRELMERELAVNFHAFVCPECHKFPRQDEWLKAVPKPDSISIFHTTRRRGYWEPVYIGTNDEPLYDDRLNWEGMSDKMTQAYELCLLKYKLSILDNAFLVHAPGIKRYVKEDNLWRKNYVDENNRLKVKIKEEIVEKHQNKKISKKCL